MVHARQKILGSVSRKAKVGRSCNLKTGERMAKRFRFLFAFWVSSEGIAKTAIFALVSLFADRNQFHNLIRWLTVPLGAFLSNPIKKQGEENKKGIKIHRA